MHKLAYSAVATAAIAGALLIGTLAIHQPKPVTASVESQRTNSIVNVRALERSMDLKTLPDGNVKGGYGEEQDGATSSDGGTSRRRLADSNAIIACACTICHRSDRCAARCPDLPKVL
jgi:hypothetical protein